MVRLHSFVSLTNHPIYLRPAVVIGDLICVVFVVSCLGDCIGHMSVAMS